ncbi:hypothetical protein PsYK624_157090 [Phanerochaete sordida]|uniref:Uncharacterized protein n=1 Tax=Phanerochaete sordida TaxID=48140 RepID=A0A9P3LLD5_9APHY|nr:hypothetical protein PsYK624_157090 [Phanerochaete sordida]
MLLKPSHDGPEPLHTTTKINVFTDDAPSPALAAKPAADEATSEAQRVLAVPTVTLNYDVVSSAMAARLATSVLSHVLFLKSQIPFPVVQLSCMPGTQKDLRAAKKREELMSAVDTLSCHLQTTFVALSAALAQRQKRLQNGEIIKTGDADVNPIYLAYVLGSSVGAAKARVLFAVDGLQAKERIAEVDAERRPEAEFRERLEDIEDGSGEHQIVQPAVNSNDSGSGSDTEDSAQEPSESSDEDEDENSATPPPPSRSPSPSPPSSIVPDTPPATRPPLSFQPFADGPSPLPGGEHDLPRKSSPLQSRKTLDPAPQPAEKRGIQPSSHTLSENVSRLSIRPNPGSPLAPTSSAPSSSLSENTPPPARRALGQRVFGTPLATSLSTPASRPTLAPTAGSRDTEQQALRAADRLLSRTLANACAEPDGGLSAELAPTQTHVLLRAPRSFAHPAWVPRQNLSRTLDAQLDAFLEDVVVPPADDVLDAQQAQKPKKKVRTGVKTEGVWVCARSGPRLPLLGTREKVGGAEVSEEDEMIWWAWDGKILGFSEW